MDQPNPAPTPAPAPAPQPQPPVSPNVPAPAKSNGLAIAALVLGIIAFLFGWAGFFNLLVAALAVVFGIIALVKHQSKGFALTGTILGGLGLLTSLIVGIFFSAAILSSASKYENTNTSTSTSQSSTQQSSTWDVNAAYDKVSNGMTKAEVEAATGKPSESCSESSSDYGKYETCTYGSYIDDNGTVTVSYTDDKVTSKSKYNASN